MTNADGDVAACRYVPLPAMEKAFRVDPRPPAGDAIALRAWNAVAVRVPQQEVDTWLALREGCVTGSTCGILLGLGLPGPAQQLIQASGVGDGSPGTPQQLP